MSEVKISYDTGNQDREYDDIIFEWFSTYSVNAHVWRNRDNDFVIETIVQFADVDILKKIIDSYINVRDFKALCQK